MVFSVNLSSATSSRRMNSPIQPTISMEHLVNAFRIKHQSASRAPGALVAMEVADDHEISCTLCQEI